MESERSTNYSVLIIALIILVLAVIAILYFARNQDQQNGGQDTPNNPTIVITIVPGTLIPQLSNGTPAAYYYQPYTQ